MLKKFKYVEAMFTGLLIGSVDCFFFGKNGFSGNSSFIITSVIVIAIFIAAYYKMGDK
jgi:hypothetical protein